MVTIHVFNNVLLMHITDFTRGALLSYYIVFENTSLPVMQLKLCFHMINMHEIITNCHFGLITLITCTKTQSGAQLLQCHQITKIVKKKKNNPIIPF